MIFVGWANIIRTQYLLPNRLDNSFCMSVVAGAVINIVANFILIPSYGAIGAAISTTISEFSVCLYQSAAGYKHLNLKVVLNKCAIFIIIGFLMYLLVIQLTFDSNIITIGFRILLGAIVYITLSYVFCKKYRHVILN